jgi:hypothetical protein
MVFKVGFFKVVTRWMAREFLFACRKRVGNLFLALTPLVLDQFRQIKVLRTHKIILFPVICGFLPKGDSKWGLLHANTTPCVKRGVITSKNSTLLELDTMRKGHTTSICLHVGQSVEYYRQ